MIKPHVLLIENEISFFYSVKGFGSQLWLFFLLKTLVNVDLTVSSTLFINVTSLREITNN